MRPALNTATKRRRQLTFFIAIVCSYTDHDLRHATEATSRLLWFNFAHLFDVAASALHRLDGRKDASCLLCGGFLPGKRDLDLSGPGDR